MLETMRIPQLLEGEHPMQKWLRTLCITSIFTMLPLMPAQAFVEYIDRDELTQKRFDALITEFQKTNEHLKNIATSLKHLEAQQGSQSTTSTQTMKDITTALTYIAEQQDAIKQAIITAPK